MIKSNLRARGLQGKGAKLPGLSGDSEFFPRKRLVRGPKTMLFHVGLQAPDPSKAFAGAVRRLLVCSG